MNRKLPALEWIVIIFCYISTGANGQFLIKVTAATSLGDGERR
jgi:hypothetical protein